MSKAVVKVTYLQGVSAVQNIMKDGESYDYREISTVLKNDHPLINDNQISGLINKMADANVFIREKKEGRRLKYRYSSEKAKYEITSRNPFAQMDVKKKYEDKAALLNELENILAPTYKNLEELPSGFVKTHEDIDTLNHVRETVWDLLRHVRGKKLITASEAQTAVDEFLNEK